MPVQQQDLGKARSATAWDIDPHHSSATFEVVHLGFALVSGRLGGIRGTIHFDAGRPEAARVEAELDPATLDTGTPPRDEHLRSADFFDVANHPVVRFASRRVERASGDEGVLVGDLTLRGVTREVPLRVRRTGQGLDSEGQRRVGLRAEATLSLQDFGMTWNQALPGGLSLIGDKVDVTLRVEGVQRT